MSFLELKNVTKTFDDGETIITNFNLTVNKNEFLTIVGPSGSGKTTILRMIAGFSEISSGEIILDSMNITSLDPNERNINTVFQNYALFPHLNVFDNVAFGLKVKKLSQNLIDKKVREALSLVKLSKYINRNISNLSGGQKQRVAIARAIVNEPKLLLLDESLSALDLKLRQEMQYELKELQKKLGITFIFVTHDQEEALTMSDRIVVMNEGDIAQIGTPENIYNEPSNVYVANFIGESNIFEGLYVTNKKVRFMDSVFECVDEHFADSENVKVVIRPEDFDVVKSNDGKVNVEVTDIVFKGVHYEIIADYKGKEIVIHSLVHPDIGDIIGLNVDPFEIHLINYE